MSISIHIDPQLFIVIYKCVFKKSKMFNLNILYISYILSHVVFVA